jgi:two-component system, chemotaxis family, protein-glutamate methylesterase/glutaminase
MAKRTPERLVVIGGSAGALEPLSTILKSLPADFPGAVAVALHLPAHYESRLPQALRRAGALPAEFATPGGSLEAGKIYVAPTDQHLLVEGDRLRLTRGPKEHRSRPAVDPLFRSAALAFGPGVIGVILSGALDDGTAGLWTVKDRGGTALVQEPSEAAVVGMPSSAIANVSVDHVAPAAELGELVDRLAREPMPPVLAQPQGDPGDLRRELAIAALDEEAHLSRERYGTPSRFGCPDCGGVLWRTSRVGPLAFRCEVGHAYGAASLAEMQTNRLEDALWASLRSLEDKAELAQLRADDAKTRGLPVERISHLKVQAQAAQEHAGLLRDLLSRDVRTGMRSSQAD